MASLVVVTPFTVQLEEPEAPGGPTKFVFPTPGTYADVPDVVAQHPYTAPHLEGYVAPPISDTADTVVMVPAETPPEPPAGEGGMTQAQRQMVEQQRAAEQRARAQREQSQANKG